MCWGLCRRGSWLLLISWGILVVVTRRGQSNVAGVVVKRSSVRWVTVSPLNGRARAGHVLTVGQEIVGLLANAGRILGWSRRSTIGSGLVEARELLSLDADVTPLGVFPRHVVTRIGVAVFVTLDQPPGPSSCRLQHVPTVEGVPEGLDPHKTPLVRKRLCLLTRDRLGQGLLGPLSIGLPAESPEVENGKDGHLNAQQQRGNADLDVGSLDRLGRLDDARARQEGDEGRLPETQEDDQLDGGDLQQGLVSADILPDLNVKLDQAIHGDGNCNGFNDHDPDMGKGRAERFETVEVKGFGDDGDDGEEHPDEAILEDADPDDL